MRESTVRIAVYRILYGQDFVQESIRSILPFVDRVIVCKAERPWGKSTGVTYKGEWVPWPERFDDTREKIAALNEPHVEIVDDQWPVTANQHQHIVNDIVLPRHQAAEVIFIEPDHVFSELEARVAFTEWNSIGARQATTRMIELWRSPAWRIPERHRASVMFHRIGGQPIGPTSGDGGQHGVSSFWLQAQVHNFGFAFSPKVMRWKHLTAMAFADEIQDSRPDPEWLDRWLNWNPEDRNLEISLGAASQIPKAFAYDVNELPAPIKARFDRGEWT